MIYKYFSMGEYHLRAAILAPFGCSGIYTCLIPFWKTFSSPRERVENAQGASKRLKKTQKGGRKSPWRRLSACRRIDVLL